MVPLYGIICASKARECLHFKKAVKTMANQPDVHNVQRAIRVPRELDARVTKRFRMDGMTIKDSYILALQFATKNVQLDAADHLRIAADIQKAKMAR